MIATSLYTCYSGRQWRTLIRETRAAKEAADAAKRSADASVASVRAWIIWAGNMGLMPVKPGEETPRYDFTIINAGKTPALNLFLSTQFKYTPPPPSKQVIPDFGRCKSVDLRTSNPNAPYLSVNIPTTISDPLPQATTDYERGIIAKKEYFGLFLKECIRYHDVLSDEERVTGICLSVFDGTLVSSCSELK
jgi:hypothetical protein